MIYLDYPTGNLKRRANVQLLYNNSKVQKQCTDLKTAKKLFGGNAALATSLFARINAMLQASVIKDIVMMPTFHFHKLSGNMDGFFAIDVKTRRDPWRIIIQPLDENEEPYERRIFKYFQYTYFRENFGLPDLPRKTNEQIKCLREFLNVASLSVFTKQNMTVSFRSASEDMKEANTARANAMVQIAINQALKIEAPKFDKKKFEKAVDYALTLTTQHGDFYPLIRKAFEDAGVIFVILPNLPGSGINGATKKIGQNVMLMVNDRRFYSDTFWFTLFHEIGHIINGDYGITFENEHAGQEDTADKYAEDKLIPPGEYEAFVRMNEFSENAIRRFAERIDRDPGIVLGRLQNDQIVPFTNVALSKALKHKYKVITS